jgi:hypothetical protein
MFKVRCHGTYPLDGGNWTIVRGLTVPEVAKLLGLTEPLGKEFLPRDPAEYNDFEFSNSCWDCGPDRYLFLNKGYVILGDRAPKSPPSELSLAVMEQLISGEVGPAVESGTEAVYVHDGRYMLIQRI